MWHTWCMRPNQDVAHETKLLDREHTSYPLTSVDMKATAASQSEAMLKNVLW